MNMIILDYGLEKDLHDYYERLSVRAIVRREDEILMVQTNQGDCMFPGGGINSEESDKVALIREVLEETGYRCKDIQDVVCISNERKEDMFESGSYINLVSKYYICQVNSTVVEQKLDEYEKGLEFKAKWIEIDEAIRMNEIFRDGLHEDDFWRLKTIEILKKIKDNEIKTLT